MRIVVVVDMDETLGVFIGDTFHVRPHVDFMIEMLRCMDADVVLWSLGDDEYVRGTVNKFLPSVKTHAHKIFARTEARNAMQKYGFPKAGEHVRDMYDEDEAIFLLGVDDRVYENMDSAYDVRIPIRPYVKPDKTDRAISNVCEKLVKGIGSVKLEACRAP